MDNNDKNKNMRGSDIIIAIIFIIFGISTLLGAFTMPLKDSYGGVDSVWYVSPALLPIIISVAMILLAIAILLFGIKEGGLDLIKKQREQRKTEPFCTEPVIRLIGTLVPLIAMVFINLLIYDFCLVIALYLTFTIEVFYLEDMSIMKPVLILYLIMTAINALIYATGLAPIMDNAFFFGSDFVALAELIILFVSIKKYIKKNNNPEVVKNNMTKYYQAMRVSLITPLLAVMVFRFFLRIPMPKEGLIMNFMYLIYYAIR